MSHIFGGFKLFDSLKINFFIGFTAQYFVTLFIEHPVAESKLSLVELISWFVKIKMFLITTPHSNFVN